MANVIKQKRGTSDPGASDLVVGELAINTTDGGVFTKTDGGTVVEVGSGGGGGASAINDLSDAVTYDSGEGIGLGTGAIANDDGTDNYNTALGYNAGNATTSGEGNVFVGYEAGSSRTTVGKSVCVGYEAGRYPTSYHVTAIGYQALKGSSSAQLAINNTAVGTYAGLNTQSTSVGPGGRNVFMGYAAAKDHTTGQRNVVIGATAGEHMTTGQKNVVIGRGAGAGETEYARRLTTGENNIIIGHHAEASSSTVSNEITLGDPNVTSLRIPGLQSGASDGQVLTYNSTNGNITLADAGGSLTGRTDSAIPFITSLGVDAADSATSTTYNIIAIGYLAAYNTTGRDNIAIGRATLYTNTSGEYNVAISTNALYNNTTGSKNVSIGINSSYNNTTGYENTAVGFRALNGNTTAIWNVAVGAEALYSNTTGSSNVAVGYEALTSQTTGYFNTAIGDECLESLTTGVSNTFVGAESGDNITTGEYNVGIGSGAFGGNRSYCTAMGVSALGTNSTGNHNVAIGWSALEATSGSTNVAVGNKAGFRITTGGRNTCLGEHAGNDITTGQDNTCVGRYAGDTLTTGSNVTCIGEFAQPSSATVSNEITLGNDDVTSFRIPGLQSGASDGQVLTFDSTNGNITLADAGGGVTYELIEQGSSKASGSYIDISGYKAVYGIFHNDPDTNSANRNGPYLSTSNSSNTGVSTQNGKWWRMGASSGWAGTGAHYQTGNHNPSTSALYYGSNTTGDFDKVWKLNLMGLDTTNVFIETHSENNGSGPSYQTAGWAATTTSGSSTWYLYIHQALARYQIYGVK